MSVTRSGKSPQKTFTKLSDIDLQKRQQAGNQLFGAEQNDSVMTENVTNESNGNEQSSSNSVSTDKQLMVDRLKEQNVLEKTKLALSKQREKELQAEKELILARNEEKRLELDLERAKRNDSQQTNVGGIQQPSVQQPLQSQTSNLGREVNPSRFQNTTQTRESTSSSTWFEGLLNNLEFKFLLRESAQDTIDSIKDWFSAASQITTKIRSEGGSAWKNWIERLTNLKNRMET